MLAHRGGTDISFARRSRDLRRLHFLPNVSLRFWVSSTRILETPEAVDIDRCIELKGVLNMTFTMGSLPRSDRRGCVICTTFVNNILRSQQSRSSSRSLACTTSQMSSPIPCARRSMASVLETGKTPREMLPVHEHNLRMLSVDTRLPVYPLPISVHTATSRSISVFV